MSIDPRLQNLLDRADRGRLMPGEVERLRDSLLSLSEERDLAKQLLIEANKTITRQFAELLELRRRDAKLSALRAGGVDNWSGYGEALEGLDDD